MTTRQIRLRLRVGEGADYSDAAIILMRGQAVVGEMVILDSYTGSNGATYLRVGLVLPDDLYAVNAREAGLPDDWLDSRATEYELTRAAIARPGASGSYRKPPLGGADSNGNGNPAASSGRWRKPGGGKQPSHNGRRW